LDAARDPKLCLGSACCFGMDGFLLLLNAAAKITPPAFCCHFSALMSALGH
jgi:hypothetical protein